MRSEFRNGRRVERIAPPPSPPHPIADLLQAGTFMAIGALAIYLGLCAADAQYAVIDQVNQESRWLPPCPAEDADNCRWDAQRQGNGRGRSFTVLNGEVTYAP